MINIAYAAEDTIENLYQVAPFVNEYINLAYYIMLALSVFMLIWGIFKFIIYAGDENGRKEGRTIIFWGVIGIFIMLSIWGIVNLLGNTVGLAPTGSIEVPVISPIRN
jgi:hypothetical protein